MKSNEPPTMLPIIPGQEPRLSYDPHTGRWSGTNGSFSIWMDDATFRDSVATLCAWPTWLSCFTPEQRFAATTAYCRRIRYWREYEHNYDQRVHITSV